MATRATGEGTQCCERRTRRGQDAACARSYDSGSLDGALVLSGGCYEYEATTPYLPFVEAFRRWFVKRRTTPMSEVLGDTAPQMAKLVPEIEARLGPFPPITTASP